MLKSNIILLVIISFLVNPKATLPEGFVYVCEHIPTLEVELKYYGAHNFVGDTIPGYKANTLILTKEATIALNLVQEELLRQNKCLKVYDGYRPQQAVNHFMEWAKRLNDTLMKSEFYPDVSKEQLFAEEYIATRSGHSRGSTVDLTIIDGSTNEPLDMGSPYDFFGEQSWVDYEHISAEQKANRQLLQTVMLNHGFYSYSKEWWHFTLKNEPFPNTYFDFEIE
ncbi:MAG TPA: M15 family metallopeptidase [Flavobacteriaceae bacterium]|nr:M15 family metallopeptidase [Flavobacteriaceae bacterium]